MLIMTVKFAYKITRKPVRFFISYCYYLVLAFLMTQAIIFTLYFTDWFRNKRILRYLDVKSALMLFVQLYSCPSCSRNEVIVPTASSPLTFTKIRAFGSFLERVHTFNEELDNLRLQVSGSRSSDRWKPPAAEENTEVILTSRDDFVKSLKYSSELQMVVLPWQKTTESGVNWSSLNDNSNLLVQQYYEWTADDQLCTWIETPGKTNLRYDVIYNSTCNRDLSKSEKPQSINTLVLNAKPIDREGYWPNEGRAYPEHLYAEQPAFAFYLYLIRDGIVNDQSDVYSGNFKLISSACRSNTNYSEFASDINLDQISLYDEVFPVAQYWGSRYFHKMVEVVPRISLYLDFLKRNTQIKILVSETGGRTVELLKILGFNKDRLISGMCRAKLIYLPRAAMCGFANPQEIQVLSMVYRNYINSNFAKEPQNKVILIRRSGRRKFTKQKNIETVVKAATKAFNLSYIEFIDNPLPSLNETMQMFHSAVMVVAPHGAGLANVVFSRPGTYVIEGVCNIPHVNLCFLRLAYVLGHHWHGVPSRYGCLRVIDVLSESLRRVIWTYLAQYQKSVRV